MFDGFKYQYKLKKLFKQRERVHSFYATENRIARKEGKTKDDIDLLEHESWSDREMIDEEISMLTTEYLTKRASQRFIPIPTHKEPGMWEKCRNIQNQYVLTHEGISKLQSALWLEQKERVDALLRKLAVLAAIISALVGLFAFLLRLK
jgi:hypothetical protein